MSWQPSRDASIGASSNSSALRSPRISDLDEAALQRYQEARRRAEAAVSSTATASAVPSSVRNIHEFVKLAAARHEARECENASAVASSVDALDQTEIAESEKAAEENALYRVYEERLFQADVKIQDLRVELVSAEAQEAAQSSEWQDRYFEEVQAARRQWQSTSDLEERAASKVDTTAAERAELGLWQKEAAECNKKWEVERRQLREELEAAKSHAELTRVRMADYELQVRQSADQVAQSARENVNFTEELAMCRAQDRMANLQTQAADAALALSIEKELHATALEQSLKAERKAMVAGESNTLAMLEAEAQTEARLAAELREGISEMTAEHVCAAEVLKQLVAREISRQKEHAASKDLHADASLLTERLSKFAEHWNDDTGKGSGSAVDAVRNVQEHIVTQRRKAASVEERANAEAASESAIAESLQRTREELRQELLEASQVQQDLHGELMVMSSAAASARALVAAKDASIAECEAASQRLATMSMEYQERRRNVGGGKVASLLADMESSSRRPSATKVSLDNTATTSGSPRAFLERRSVASASSSDVDKQLDKASIAEQAEDQRRAGLNDREKADWRRWASIAGASLAGGDRLHGDAVSTASTLEHDNASSVDQPCAESQDTFSTYTSASDKVKLQSNGLAFGKASVQGGPSPSTDGIPGVFAKFRAALRRAEGSVAPEPQQVQSARDHSALVPNWEYTQKVMTDQLRHDLSELRQVFSQLPPEDRSLLTEERRPSLSTIPAVRTRSPPAPKGGRVQLRSTDVPRNATGESQQSPRALSQAMARGSTIARSLSKACRTALQEQSASSVPPRSLRETMQMEQAQAQDKSHSGVEKADDKPRRGHSPARSARFEAQQPLSARPLLSARSPGMLSPREASAAAEPRGSVTLPSEVQRSASLVATSPRHQTSSPQGGLQAQSSASKRVESNGIGAKSASIRFSMSPAVKTSPRSEATSQPSATASAPRSSFSSPVTAMAKAGQHPVAPQHFMPSLPVKR